MKQIRNIGILAHVDAGKTTLTEQILYKTGHIRKVGRVDKGNAQTDALDVERERGISVKSASAKVTYKDTEINIIDTPGHVDFQAEVERALMVLDGAILVISCIEGVQSQTETIWKALQKLNIPTMIFVNKIDRLGANIKHVMKDIKMLINDKGIEIVNVANEGCKDAYIYQDEKVLLEKIVLRDESLFNRYVEDERITKEEINQFIQTKTTLKEIVPIIFGAALNGIGIDEVLEGVINYLPQPVINEQLMSLIYKVNNELSGGKMSHVRLYGGSLKVRDEIYNHTRKTYEKITHLYQFEGAKTKQVDELFGGDIGIIGGLKSSKIGDVLGTNENERKPFQLNKPTLTVQVVPKIPNDLERLVNCFQYLEEEDPYLNVMWNKEARELHVQLMGLIQMEILTNLIKERFDLQVHFEKPTVIYKETPRKKGKGFISLKTPVFGSLEMEVAPLERGSGVEYEAVYTTDFIFPNFQTEVKNAYQAILREGVYGYEVTDIKVMLTGGRSIKLATQPGHFRKMTPIPLMKALKDADMALIEPIYFFTFKFDMKDAGKVLNDLYNMEAKIKEQTIVSDEYYIEGLIPMRTSMDYIMNVKSLSKGKSEFITKFHGYDECPKDFKKIRQRTMVDPSDVKRYLLSILPKSQTDLNNGNK